MYSSGYSQVNKYSPEAQKRMQYRSKGKSCGYYMRIVFFFSSLIQTLIIVSLVLFLLYGKKEDTTSTSRIQDLEKSFSQLSIENVALRQQRKNLTNLLNVTLTKKAIIDWDMKRFYNLINISAQVIQDLQKKNLQCNNELLLCKFTPSTVCQTKLPINCGVLVEQLNARFKLVESNFSHTVHIMRMEMDQAAKERDDVTLDAIQLRRHKSILEKELQSYQQKTKDDFSQHLSGVSNVSKAFLQKIDSLFPAHIPFQLTCAKQREHLEQIRTNCTSLSREVENKLQVYLNIVGDQVSDIQAENNRLKAENWRLSEDYRWCSQNRSGLIREHKVNLEQLQAKHDKDKEKLLMDKMKLNGDIEVLTNNVKFKSKEVDHLQEQVKNLNMSCMSKVGFGGSTSRGSTIPLTSWNSLGGGGSSFGSSSSASGASRTGSASLGSSISSFGSYNKPVSTGTGSSSSSFLSSGSKTGLGSSGSGFNKPVSTGTGSSSSSFLSSGSNTGLGSTGSGFNKPVSTGTGSSSSSPLMPDSNPGLGSTGSVLNKPTSTRTGSSSSTFVSTGSNPGLSSNGSGVIKPLSTGTGSSSSSSSSGSSPNLSSAGSEVNKPFSGFGLTGLSSSGPGSNKPELTARGTSTSSSSSSSGSVGPNPNLSSGSNKPATSVKSSSSLGSSPNSGSTSRTSSISGLSWFGFGSSNSGQTKAGTGTGKESGTSHGGTGSTFGAGRTNGLAGGTINVAQHLQELQRIINPPGPEEKQDLSRMLG